MLCGLLKSKHEIKNNIQNSKFEPLDINTIKLINTNNPTFYFSLLTSYLLL